MQGQNLAWALGPSVTFPSSFRQPANICQESPVRMASLPPPASKARLLVTWCGVVERDEPERTAATDPVAVVKTHSTTRRIRRRRRRDRGRAQKSRKSLFRLGLGSNDSEPTILCTPPRRHPSYVPKVAQGSRRLSSSLRRQSKPRLRVVEELHGSLHGIARVCVLDGLRHSPQKQ